MLKHKFLLSIILTAVLICQSSQVSALPIVVDLENSANYHYLTNPTTYDKVEGLILNGRTMVPLRAISNEFGLNPVWDAKNQTITITDQANNTIVLTINKNTYLKTNTVCDLDAPATIINSTTYVPLVVISSLFSNINVKYASDVFGEGPFVYLTHYKLLDDSKEFALLNNYELTSSKDTYYLKAGCKTAEGIQLGDTASQVVKSYGKPRYPKPFDESVLDNYNDSLMYFGDFKPNSAQYTMYQFDFKDGKLTKLILYKFNYTPTVIQLKVTNE